MVAGVGEVAKSRVAGSVTSPVMAVAPGKQKVESRKATITRES